MFSGVSCQNLPAGVAPEQVGGFLLLKVLLPSSGISSRATKGAVTKGRQDDAGHREAIWDRGRSAIRRSNPGRPNNST